MWGQEKSIGGPGITVPDTESRLACLELGGYGAGAPDTVGPRAMGRNLLSLLRAVSIMEHVSRVGSPERRQEMMVD